MAKIQETQTLVFEVLTEYPETRGDDYLLTFEVLKKLGVVFADISYVFLNHATLGLPSFETITRCRRKIQSKHSELVGKKMREIRKKEEQAFKQYAFDIE